MGVDDFLYAGGKGLHVVEKCHDEGFGLRRRIDAAKLLHGVRHLDAGVRGPAVFQVLTFGGSEIRYFLGPFDQFPDTVKDRCLVKFWLQGTLLTPGSGVYLNSAVTSPGWGEAPQKSLKARLVSWSVMVSPSCLCLIVRYRSDIPLSVTSPAPGTLVVAAHIRVAPIVYEINVAHAVSIGYSSD